METVTIDGVEYVKALALAKKFNYTADYIGQLCRAHKVDAQLVGRTWYVYPPSLESHKSTRYAELRSNEKSINNTSKTISSRFDVPSPISNNVVKSYTTHFENRAISKTQAYESDTTDLLPDLVKESSEKILPTSPLPEALKVQSFEPKAVFNAEISNNSVTNSLEATESDENTRFIAVNKSENNVIDLKKSIGNASEVALHRFHEATSDIRMVSAPPGRAAKGANSLNTNASVMRGDISLVPRKIVPELKIVTSATSSATIRRSSLFFRLVVVPVVILFVLFTAAALLCIESVLTVREGGDQEVSWRLNTSIVSSFGTTFLNKLINTL